MTAIFILSILTLLVFQTYAQNDFTVTSPSEGDTVTLSSSAIEGAIVPIRWTVAESLANKPVISGPELWLIVFTVFTMPMTAVRSFGSTTAERKALRGAWSMEARLALITKRATVGASDPGSGTSESRIALGRCVKTMVFTSPMRFAMADANTFPMLERNCADPMMLPSSPSGRENFLEM